MGLLDDLKKEAETLKNQEAQRTQSLKANAIQVDQAMRSIYKYMNELFRQLNVVKPPCARSYNLLTVGKIEGLIQSDYRIEYRTSQRNNSEHYEELNVTFRRAKPETMTIKREAEHIERFRDLLWQNNMRFTSEPFRNERRVVTHEFFTVNHEVICGADIVGDYDEGVIRFKLKNVEDFGPSIYTVEPSVIEDKSLEELAKLFIGQAETNFEQFNRRPTFNAGGVSGQYPKASTKNIQYAVDPNPKSEEEEAKKRGLFGLFKK
jgi:hypothetical protein